jgi:hypothetical protein
VSSSSEKSIITPGTIKNNGQNLTKKENANPESNHHKLSIKKITPRTINTADFLYLF